MRERKGGGGKGGGCRHAVSRVTLFNDHSVLAVRFKHHVLAQLRVHIRRQILEKIEGDGQALERADFIGCSHFGVLHESILHKLSLVVRVVHLHAGFVICVGVSACAREQQARCSPAASLSTIVMRR